MKDIEQLEIVSNVAYLALQSCSADNTQDQKATGLNYAVQILAPFAREWVGSIMPQLGAFSDTVYREGDVDVAGGIKALREIHSLSCRLCQVAYKARSEA